MVEHKRQVESAAAAAQGRVPTAPLQARAVWACHRQLEVLPAVAGVAAVLSNWTLLAEEEAVHWSFSLVEAADNCLSDWEAGAAVGC